MRRRRFITLTAGVVALATKSFARERDAIEVAANRLGADRIATLRFAGSGATFTTGQNFRADRSVAPRHGQALGGRRQLRNREHATGPGA
jgi:hypothetical protein